MFLLTRSALATLCLQRSMWWLSQEPKMRGSHFYLGARTQGKIDAFHLVRTESPTHTEVRVFPVFVKKNKHRIMQVNRNN
jgi:hypothetical protein